MSASPDDDDDELELEPIDPEILAHERSRAQAKTDEALARVEFEDLYRESEPDPLIDVEGLRRFRFTTRHLLIATAVLALVTTLFRLTEHLCLAIMILFVVVLVGGWAYVIRRERALAREKERLRAEFEAGRREKVVAPIEMTFDDEPPREPFRIAFSLKQLFVAMTVAALLMGVLTLAAQTATVALILGLAAIVGLVATALGFEAPALVVLGWWMLLVCYILLGLWLAVFGDDAAAGAMRRTANDSVRVAKCEQAEPLLTPAFRAPITPEREPA